MVDSGNFLRDPITGDAVIVVNGAVAEKLFDKSDIKSLFDISTLNLEKRFRIIPANGVTGSKLLTAIRPDDVKIEGNSVKCLIAFSDNGKKEKMCIVPESII